MPEKQSRPRRSNRYAQTPERVSEAVKNVQQAGQSTIPPGQNQMSRGDAQPGYTHAAMSQQQYEQQMQYLQQMQYQEEMARQQYAMRIGRAHV